MVSKFRTIASGFILFGSAMASLHAATYYVSVAGSDGNPGTASAPFRHVSRGVASATTPGDTVIVMDGTYDNEGVTGGNYVVTLYHSGAPGNPITIMAQNRGRAILDGGNRSTGGCTGAAAYFNLYNASFVTIQGFVIQNACDAGFQSNDGAHDIAIRWNEIRNIGNWWISDQYGRDGIYLNNSEYNFTFDGNVFHDIGRVGGVSDLHFDHGIYSHASNVTIINNVFYNMSKGWSIQFADGAANYLIANNTFAFPNASGENGQIMFWGGNSNITITNNIFYQPAGSALTQFAANISAQFDHNLIFGTGTVMSNGGGVSVGSGNRIGVDPMFTNPGGSDFTLRAGSPAIGSGASLASVATDIKGSRRNGAFDIGAYQAGAGSPGPAPSNPAPSNPAPSDPAPPPPPPPPSPAFSISNVNVSSITTYSAVLTWTTNVPSTSSARYGVSANYTNPSDVDPTMLTMHSVLIYGLAPNNVYHFMVSSQDANGNVASSGDYTFSTTANY